MKKLAQAITAFLLIFLMARPADAAIRCESQYGGGEVCVYTGELQIDKEVWNKETEEFVDNMGLFDYKYAPGEKIVFKLTIKNVGDETFDNVNLKDILPEYLKLSQGEVEWEITDLSPDESEERRLSAEVQNLPNDNTTICVVNQAEVWSGDESDKDTAQVCLTEEKVLGVEELPPTGPEDWLSFFAFASLTGLVGLYLANPALRLRKS